MKNLSEITAQELEKIKIVTFDIDGVIIPVGTQLKENEDGTELYMKSKQLSRTFIENLKELKKYVRLNFSSGRNLLYLRSLVNEIFDDRVILQAENGNLTWVGGRITHHYYPNEYFYKLRNIKESIKRLAVNGKRIRGFEPKMFIVTVHCDELDDICNVVREHDPDNKFYCLWTNEGYDIGSKEVSKGQGILRISEIFGIQPKYIMTTGNNHNDKEMLEVGLGVTVDPDRVKGDYFIQYDKAELGGEKLAEFLLHYYQKL